MKIFTHIILTTLAICIIISCKKESSKKEIVTTLSSRTYVKNYKQENDAVKSDFWLIKPDNRQDLESANTIEENCPKHSIIAFSARGVIHHQSEVPPGNYILVVKISILADGYNWSRYSYKDLKINEGDRLVENMYFSYEGTAGTYEMWNDEGK